MSFLETWFRAIAYHWCAGLLVLSWCLCARVCCHDLYRRALIFGLYIAHNRAHLFKIKNGEYCCTVYPACIRSLCWLLRIDGGCASEHSSRDSTVVRYQIKNLKVRNAWTLLRWLLPGHCHVCERATLVIESNHFRRKKTLDVGSMSNIGRSVLLEDRRSSGILNRTTRIN